MAFCASLHLSFGFLQRGLKVLGVHARDDLAGFDHVAFVGTHFGDASGEFRVDVDLVRFDPAVAPGDPGRQLRLGVLPPINAAPAPPTRTARASTNRSQRLRTGIPFEVGGGAGKIVRAGAGTRSRVSGRQFSVRGPSRLC